MEKKRLLIIGIILVFIILLLFVYPNIEFYKDNYLYMMSYSSDYIDSEDLKELEQEFCYDESYSYNKKRNISTSSFSYNNFLFFKWFKVSYKKGNVCDKEYLLEESYINNFLENAKIIENESNVDLGKLIEGKKAIVSNKRYSWNDNNKYIGYMLDNKYMDMFIWTNEEGLLIIQVGLSDEGSKYIAYK